MLSSRKVTSFDMKSHSLEHPLSEPVPSSNGTAERRILSACHILPAIILLHFPSRTLPVLVKLSAPLCPDSTPRVLPNLDEPDILALLPETLAAEVETIFADETSRMSADAAVQGGSVGIHFLQA